MTTLLFNTRYLPGSLRGKKQDTSEIIGVPFLQFSDCVRGSYLWIFPKIVKRSFPEASFPCWFFNNKPVIALEFGMVYFQIVDCLCIVLTDRSTIVRMEGAWSMFFQDPTCLTWAMYRRISGFFSSADERILWKLLFSGFARQKTGWPLTSDPCPTLRR